MSAVRRRLAFVRTAGPGRGLTVRSRAMLLGLMGLLVLAGCSDSAKDLASSDPQARVQTIRVLAAGGGDAAAERVASVARHEDTATATEAIVALGRMSSDRAVDALAEVAMKEERAALRQLAVTALSQHKTAKSVETFRQVVGHDPVPEVRAAAAMGLATQGGMDDVPLLVEAAGAETDLAATRSEVTAMGAILGVYFPNDPNDPPEVRQENLARTRDAADHLYKVRKGLLPQDMQCGNMPGGGR